MKFSCAAKIGLSHTKYTRKYTKETKRLKYLYDSFQQILNTENNISNLNKALGINKKNYLQEQDFHYIEEHLLCTAPMAEPLDIMQGETNTYYRVVLPYLLALRRKIEVLAKPIVSGYTANL